MLKQFLFFLLLVSLLFVVEVNAGENQEYRFHAGPLYQSNDGLYGVVLDLPLSIKAPKLLKDNVSLIVNGNETGDTIDLKPFNESGEKLAWLVSVDVSGSMAGAPLEDIKDSLFSLLGDRHFLQVGLISFGNESRVEFGIDQEDEGKLLTDAVHNLKDHGGRSKTKLYQALYEALDYFDESSKTADVPSRKRILVISDGKDEGSSISAQNVIDRSKGLGIPIDAVGRGRIEQQYIESLRLLAEGTGGYFVHAEPDRLSLSDALKRIYQMLMETRTAVAYFEKYEADKTKELTNHVAVAIHFPTSKLISARLNASLPIPLQLDPLDARIDVETDDTKPTKPLWEEWWMWLLAITVLMAVTVKIVFPDMRMGGKNRPVKQTSDEGNRVQETGLENIRGETSIPVNDGRESPPLPLQNTKTTNVTPKVRRETVVGGMFASPQLNKPSVLLVGVDGAVKKQKIGIDKEVFYIGASADNDLTISDDQFVSSRHACIRYEQGSLYILDQNSSNGTFVNGERLDSSACLLIPGSRIKIGESVFEIHKTSG